MDADEAGAAGGGDARAAADVGMVYTDKWRCEPGRDRFHWKSPTNMPEDGIIFDKALDEQVYNIGPQAVLIRRDCFDKVGLFDEKLYNFNDWDMFVRISRHFLFFHIPEPLVNYNVSADAMTATGEDRGIVAIETLFHKYLPDLEKNPALCSPSARTGSAAFTCATGTRRRAGPFCGGLCARNRSIRAMSSRCLDRSLPKTPIRNCIDL